MLRSCDVVATNSHRGRKCFHSLSAVCTRHEKVVSVGFWHRQLDTDEGTPEPLRTRQSRRQSPRSEDHLRAAVSMKMEEDDLRGAICLASSNSSITAPTKDTFHALLDKHPPPSLDYSPPPSPLVSTPISVSQAEIVKAIKSFPLGSSAGPDGLKPQHLKSSLPPDSFHSPFLSALADFSSRVGG